MSKKNKIWIFRIFSLFIGFGLVLLIDFMIGKVYHIVAPDFGKKNLKIALSESDGDKKHHLKHKPHPYITYENTPNYISGKIRQHNNLGYRNTKDTKIKRTKFDIRILALGGSTTYGTGVKRPDSTWVEQLEELLNNYLQNKESKYKVEIINGGMPWATTAELLNHYVFRDKYLKPDIVIIHTGGNDGGPLAFNNYNPEYTHWRNIEATKNTGLRPGEADLIKFSNIVKLFYAIWYSKINYAGTNVFIKTKKLSLLKKEEVSNNAKKNEPLGFERNLNTLLRNIKNDNSVPFYFHFYQPGKEIFSDKGKYALEKANKVIHLSDNYESMQIIKKKIKQRAILICNNNDVNIHEIEQGTIPIEYFVDQCHLNRFGQTYKATFVYNEIKPILDSLIYSKNLEILQN